MTSINPYKYEMLSDKEKRAYISRCKWEYELFRPITQKSRKDENSRTN